MVVLEHICEGSPGMEVQVEKVEKYLGQPIKDPYGRVIGHLVSFYSDSDGYVTDLEICLGEITFKQLPVDRFKFTGEGLILIPEWQYQAEKVAQRLERLKKRLHAIEDLYSRKEIPRHAYETFKKKLEDALMKVKEESRKVKELLKAKTHELEDVIIELEKAFTSVKMSYIAGEVSDKTYKAAADQLRKHLEYAADEKQDIKRYIERLEKLETQPIVKPKEPEPIIPSQNQPLPVVVIEGS